MITVLDLEDGSEIMTLAGHPAAVNDVAFDPIRERLYSAPLTGGTRIWDITPAGPAGSGVIPIDSGQNISSSPGPVKVVVSPSGSELAVTTGGGKITRYASDSGAILGSVDGAMNWFLPAPVSPDWRLLAVMPLGIVSGTGDPLPEASIERMTTGELVGQLPPCLWPKGFSSDGAMLALDGREVSSLFLQCSPENVAADVDPRSRVIDVLTGEVLLDLGERPLLSGSALFNPPGVFEADRYLAVNVGFEVVEIHDMATGQVVAEMYIEGETPLSIAFDPTGQYLATGGQNGHAWVVDVKALVGGASVEEAMVMYEEVGSGGVGQVALGPDGVLATVAHDPNIRLWDIQSSQVIHELARTPDVPRPVAFGPGGELLYIDGSMEQGHVVRKFLLDPDRLIELARSRVTGSLTEEECQRYLPDSNLVTCP